MASVSVKDKLLGEILGDYNQAFAFNESMEANIDSDDEVEELSKGLLQLSF